MFLDGKKLGSGDGFDEWLGSNDLETVGITEVVGIAEMATVGAVLGLNVGSLLDMADGAEVVNELG